MGINFDRDSARFNSGLPDFPFVGAKRFEHIAFEIYNHTPYPQTFTFLGIKHRHYNYNGVLTIRAIRDMQYVDPNEIAANLTHHHSYMQSPYSSRIIPAAQLSRIYFQTNRPFSQFQDQEFSYGSRNNAPYYDHGDINGIVIIHSDHNKKSLAIDKLRVPGNNVNQRYDHSPGLSINGKDSLCITNIQPQERMVFLMFSRYHETHGGLADRRTGQRVSCEEEFNMVVELFDNLRINEILASML